tara:strand:+ start:86 stop:361 length:276 start_codon:yes stop_codon:yes gene_type:complete
MIKEHHHCKDLKLYTFLIISLFLPKYFIATSLRLVGKSFPSDVLIRPSPKNTTREESLLEMETINGKVKRESPLVTSVAEQVPSRGWRRIR